MVTGPPSIPDVVDVEWLSGAEAPPGAVPDLLVEVPHGADERVHYDRLRGALRGDLPADLHEFFHINTDVGAWAYGRATAARVVAARPRTCALLVRSLIPRTFVDCNRPVQPGEPRGDGSLAGGQLTPGVPPYVRDPRDLELLLDRHRRYVETAARAFALVCGGGGLALVPHSYGPTTIGVDRVDDDIVERLRWAMDPARAETWPERPEIDLLTRTADGAELAPGGIEAELLEAFAAAGFVPRANDTYDLHPGSLAHRWSHEHPGRVLCLEARRDLLVEQWTPFEEMRAVPAKVERIAAVLAPALAARL